VEDEYKKAISEITEYYNASKDIPLEEFLVKPPELPSGVTLESIPPEEQSLWLKWSWNPKGLTGLPPLEKYVVWDDDYKKFASNWGVGYSSYLTMLYGFQTQLEFEKVARPISTRWNRVLGRAKRADQRKNWLYAYKNWKLTEKDVLKEKIEGKRTTRQYILDGDTKVYLPTEMQSGVEMTLKNLEVIKEMEEAGFKVEDLVAKFVGDDVLEEDLTT
jgi:hypothetical protein